MKTSRQAGINFAGALFGLSQLLFIRLSGKFGGILLLAAFAAALVALSPRLSPSIETALPRIELFHMPVLTKTLSSEGSKSLSNTSFLESQGLIETDQGFRPFSKKLRVYATSYDKNCRGCNEITATGLKAGFGVIAVDPKVIPLGSKIFIPGYGTAIAGDTGGKVKGSKIDLGFDDVKTGWWKARYVEVYLLK